MKKITRDDFIKRIFNAFKVHPIIALLGPRQCGKTTAAQLFMKRYKGRYRFHRFDLENPYDLARLDEPMLALEKLEGIIILDEIQRRPELFPLLRVLADRHKKQKFLILGSASRDLIAQSSESLAGRIRYLELTPFHFEEVDHLPKLWLRGGFPRSYLARSESASYEWRESYVSTFLEKDVPSLGIKIPSRSLRKFWMMLAHCHGAIFNASEIGRSMGIAHTTSRHYLDILTGTFMIRELQPWFENISKRQIKSPKLYFRDSGLFHFLLGIKDRQTLTTHPKLGASWEGFALEEIIRLHQATPEETFFWGVHSQLELDLLIVKEGKKYGFEIKYADAPRLTPSLIKAEELLNLDKLTVIYPGKQSYWLSSTIQVIGLEQYL